MEPSSQSGGLVSLHGFLRLNRLDVCRGPPAPNPAPDIPAPPYPEAPQRTIDVLRFADYPTGTTSQPDEHTLELSRAHLLELDAALTELGATPSAI